MTRRASLIRAARSLLDMVPLAVFGVLLGIMLLPWPSLLVTVGCATVVWLVALGWRGPTPRPSSTWLRSPWLLAPALAFIAWAHGPALGGDFVTDDFGCLQLWHAKSAGQILHLGDISEGIWGAPDDELRPVFALWYKALLSIFGASARPLHAANVLLHLLSCLTVYGIARQWWGASGNGPAVAAALLFGLMPVHAEPVAWLIGGVDVLSSLFYLAVLLLFARFRATRRRGAWLAAAALSVPAMFTKEIVVTLPATLLAFDLLVASPYSWRRGQRTATVLHLAAVHAPFVLASGGFLVLRRLAFHSFAREGRLIERVPWFVSSLPTRLRWFLLPDPIEGVWRLAGSSLAAAGLLACLIWLWRHRDGHRQALAWVACFGLVVPVVTHLPLIVTYLSPRHLYLPGAALALAAAAALFPRSDDGAGASASAVRVTVWVLLLVVFVPALRHGHRQWRAAEDTSHAVRLGIDAATERLPSGSFLVIAGVPDQQPPALVWRFALPFALQPPFIRRDLDRSFQLIETPDLYCCPLEYWWRRRMPPLARLLDGPPEERVDIHLAAWSQGRIRLWHARPRRRLVRGLVEQALGRTFTAHATGSLEEARALVARLADLARRGAPLR